jgi:hypothetical protein
MAAWEVSSATPHERRPPKPDQNQSSRRCCSTSRIVVRRKLAVSSGFVKKKGTLQEGRGERERERFLGTRPLRKAPLRRVFSWPDWQKPVAASPGLAGCSPRSGGEGERRRSARGGRVFGAAPSPFLAPSVTVETIVTRFGNTRHRVNLDYWWREGERGSPSWRS